MNLDLLVVAATKDLESNNGGTSASQNWSSLKVKGESGHAQRIRKCRNITLKREVESNTMPYS
jgi:hypothetical protein